MIPEPDYSDEDEDEAGSEKEADQAIEEVTAKQDTRRRPLATRIDKHDGQKTETLPTKEESDSPKVSRDGLVVPKKPGNPYLESAERQRLCKELKFNHKYGRSTFNPKSELQIALDKYQEEKLRKSMEAAKKTSLEKILEQQAKKIEMQEKEPVQRRPSWIDRLQEQQDSWIPSDSRTNEFFRVHARVMSSQSSNNNSSDSSQSSDTSPRLSNTNDHRASTTNRGDLVVRNELKEEESDDSQSNQNLKKANR